MSGWWSAGPAEGERGGCPDVGVILQAVNRKGATAMECGDAEWKDVLYQCSGL